MLIEKDDNRTKIISFNPTKPEDVKEASDLLLDKFARDTKKDGLSGTPTLSEVLTLTEKVGAALFFDPVNKNASFHYDPSDAVTIQEVEDKEEDPYKDVESYPVDTEEDKEDDPF